jgi:hypothetical protein
MTDDDIKGREPLSCVEMWRRPDSTIGAKNWLRNYFSRPVVCQSESGVIDVVHALEYTERGKSIN